MINNEYPKAKRLGDRSVRRAISEGRYPYLFALQSFLPDYDQLAKIPLGVHDIPLDMIAGTVNASRQNAFSYDFRPVLGTETEFAVKWNNLFDSQDEVGIRDPIKVYEYMNRFYVQEGNKRVSVMVYLDGVSIAAEVIRVMPRRTGEKEVNIYFEYIGFYNVTGQFEITFTEEGRYAKLADLYGQNLTDRWPDHALELLRTDFHAFQEAMAAKSGNNLGISTNGNNLDITAGDAFLKYLSVYPPDTIAHDSKAQVAKNVAAIWNEILTTNSDSIVVIEDADEHVTKKSGGILSALTPVKTYTPEDPLKVSFIYSKNPKNSSWTYAHELGRSEVEQNYDGIVRTTCFDDRGSDAEIDAAFAEAAAAHCDVVFTTAPGLMEASLRAAVLHPEMKILNCSINLSSSAVRTYYARMYEAKYLMGSLAASLADDHRIGYLADYPIYGTIANINAFAIGAAMMDPRCKIVLKWSGVRDSHWDEEFNDEGIKMISGPDYIRPDDNQRRYGVYKIRDNGTMFKIAAPLWRWGKFYDLIIDSIIDGSWGTREQVGKSHALNYWYGMSSGVIDVIISDDLPYYCSKLISQLHGAVSRGALLPFDDEIRSQTGIIHKAGDPPLSNEQIITMNWLNDNVIGSIPTENELVASVHSTVEVSGVKTDK